MEFNSIKVVCDVIIIYPYLIFISIMLALFIYYYVVLTFADCVLVCMCWLWLCLIDLMMTQLVSSLLGSIDNRHLQVWVWCIIGSGKWICVVFYYFIVDFDFYGWLLWLTFTFEINFWLLFWFDFWSWHFGWLSFISKIIYYYFRCKILNKSIRYNTADNALIIL